MLINSLNMAYMVSIEYAQNVIFLLIFHSIQHIYVNQQDKCL